MNNSILRLPEVTKMTGLSRSSIYLMANNGSFPKQVSLGERAVGWVEKEILTWLQQKADARAVK
ncbi:MAG: AlpA family phage regulatory protein [Alphaproteobacteria bacterium]|nr:AlpA family phage regulatory protein [Alphaproteobacteria bacterium]